MDTRLLRAAVAATTAAGIVAIAGAQLAGAQDVAALRRADPPPHGIWTPPPALKLSLAGEAYPHGVPLLANADLTVALDRQASRFVATVGIDDERNDGQGSASFEVWVDGRKAADSGVIKSGAPPKLLSVDLAGAKRMTLAVGDAGDGPRDDLRSLLRSG
jgi:hypothetical protein